MTDHALIQAWHRLQQGDPTGAQALVLAYLEQQPQAVAGWLLLAETQADPNARRAALERALTLEPTNPQALKALAALPAMPAKHSNPSAVPTGLSEPPAQAVPAGLSATPRHGIQRVLFGLIGLTALLLIALIAARLISPSASDTVTRTPPEMRVQAFLNGWAELLAFNHRDAQAMRLGRLLLVPDYALDYGPFLDALKPIDDAAFTHELAGYGAPPQAAWVEAELTLEEFSSTAARVRVSNAVLVVELTNGQQFRSQNYLPAIEQYSITNDPVYGWRFVE